MGDVRPKHFSSSGRPVYSYQVYRREATFDVADFMQLIAPPDRQLRMLGAKLIGKWLTIEYEEHVEADDTPPMGEGVATADTSDLMPRDA